MMNQASLRAYGVLLCLIAFPPAAWAGGPAHLDYGESYKFTIPGSLKSPGAREGYFHTHGPVIVFAYEPPCVVTIRDPDHPEPPVASGSVEPGFRYYETTLPAGYYYISVITDAGVLVGVSNSSPCNGYYHVLSSGEAYGDHPLSSRWYLRATGGCDNQAVIFSPLGASSGSTCCDTICLESCGELFDLTDSNDYHVWAPGDLIGVLQVQTGNPVMVLARDDAGYFVPPYSTDASSYSYFYTVQGPDEHLNIHSFADGTEYRIDSLHTTPPTYLDSGTLAEGETSVTDYDSVVPFRRFIRVRTTKDQASVSVLGGSVSADTNYKTYLLDAVGNMQGTDFMTRSHSGGNIVVTGLEGDTTIEVRDAETSALQSVHSVTAAQIVNVNPGSGIWRIRGDKDFTACVFKGNGATFIPLTRNTSGSTPYPPVIAGVNYSPHYPRTSDNWLNVTWLTDELATSRLNYKIGSEPWSYRVGVGTATQHAIPIDIAPITTQTEVRFRPEGTDQSGMTTVDDNSGNDYVVTVVEDAPDIQVQVSTVPHGVTDTLHFNVGNYGAGDANDVEIRFRLYGLQPYGENVIADYSHIASDRIDAVLSLDHLAAGSSAYPTIAVRPYLSHNGNIDYRLDTCTSSAEDDWGHRDHFTHPTVLVDWDDANVESAMGGSEYVVLANLARFFAFNPQTNISAQEMPQAMCAFADRRGAVSAYIHTGDCYAIRNFIQGRFNGVLDPYWFDAGYLLLVGCSGVMPAFGWHLSCPWMDFDVSVSDNTYANVDNDGHYTPELIVGRVTGDNADNYISLFERGTSAQHFDKAMAVSGTGDGEGTFADNASECRNRLAVRYPDTEPYFRLGAFAQSDRRDVYVDNCDEVDFLYYRNHGNVTGWDEFSTWDVWRLSFGTKFPIVYSNACLTGRIQDANNFAEEFLARHAAVFIGATEVSPRDKNNQMGNTITAGHRNGSTIGRAFRDAKRSLAGDIHWYTTCWQDQVVKKEILIYNLYGDPFRGGLFHKGGEEIEYDEPGEYLAPEVAMYEVRAGEDGFDHVTIPDPLHAGELQVINEPIVPVYRWTANLRPGRRMNAISLVSRSGEIHDSGLNLPTAWWNEKVLRGPGDVPSPGTFPPDDFHWTAIENADGGQEVILTVHPFFYNATTQDATFYQSYVFQLDIVSSSLTLAIRPLQATVPLGDPTVFDMAVHNNSPDDRDVTIDIEISDMGTSEVVANPLVPLLSSPALTTVTQTVSWDPAGFPATHYQVTAQMRDAESGDELDVASARFRVGVPAVAMTGFHFTTTTPGFVGINEDVDVGSSVQSVGDIPVSGTGFLRIRRQDNGLIVYDRQGGFVDLAPLDSAVFGDIWNSSGTEEGGYVFQTWVEFEAGATPVLEIPFQTKKPMRMGWNLPQDIYGHGDSIFATCDLFERDGTPVGPGDTAAVSILRPNLSFFFPGLDVNFAYPHYSTGFVVTAAQPSGPYAFISTAEKTGYQPALGGRWFVVSDNTFTLEANPPIGVADGVSAVHLLSETVMSGGNPIPDGTLMTLATWGGVIATPDADPVLVGHQVASNGGVYEFDWQAPPAANLDAFVYGTLGMGQPETGKSMRFKGIDFNNNRRVDVSDILFIRSGEGLLFDTPSFDRRKDMNENGVIEVDDTDQAIARWPMELAGMIHCPTCPPATGTFGVKLRPVPDRASLPPGGEFVVDIVAEGVVDLAGYDYGLALTGDALSMSGAPAHASIFPPTATVGLGPEPMSVGYRMGGFSLSGDETVTGTVILGSVGLHADNYGETRLILSSPVFSDSQGNNQRLLQSVVGIYRVEDPSPTPTVTPTPTETSPPIPTPTTSLTPVPTQTPNLPGDMNGDGMIDSWDLFHFSLYWKWNATGADERCNMEEDAWIDSKDLLEMIRATGGN